MANKLDSSFSKIFSHISESDIPELAQQLVIPELTEDAFDAFFLTTVTKHPFPWATSEVDEKFFKIHDKDFKVVFEKLPKKSATYAFILGKAMHEDLETNVEQNATEDAVSQTTALPTKSNIYFNKQKDSEHGESQSD